MNLNNYLNNLRKGKRTFQNQIETYDKKYRAAKFSRFEHKAMLTIVFGILSFIMLSIINLGLASLGTQSLGTILPAWVISSVTILSSLGIGAIIGKHVEKKQNLKTEIQNNLSKTEQEKLESEIRNEIELERTKNESKLNEELISQVAPLEKNNLELSDLDETLSKNLDDETALLTSLSAQKILNERFRSIRNKKSNFLDTLAFTLTTGIGVTYFTHISLPITGGVVNYYSLLATFIISSIGGLTYKINKNRKERELFNKINGELGSLSLPTTIENSDVEAYSIKEKIEENIKTISKNKTDLIKERELLELSKTNTQKSLSEKQVLRETPILNSNETELTEEPAIRTLRPRY